MKEFLVQIESLTKSFPKGFWRKREKVVDRISFDVERGEAFGLVGHNGAGKTTLLKCMVGLLRPDNGKITLFGDSILSSKVKHRIGFLPEYPYFYDYLTGQEFLDLCARLFGLPYRERRKRIYSLMERVGLLHFRDRLLRRYSKGMLQRVGIAQALINDPDLLLLDEPMSGLDPIGRKEIRDLLLELKREGKTLLLSSHILSDVETLCDRTGFLVAGEMTHCGSVKALVESKIESYEIVISGLSIDILQRWTDSSIDVLPDSDQARIRVRDLTEVNRMVDEIRKNGGQIVSITPMQLSLEEIYSKQISDLMKE